MARTVQTLNIILPPQMSKMHEHAVRAGLWWQREGSKAVTGNIDFFDAIIHVLHTPKEAIIIRDASCFGQAASSISLQTPRSQSSMWSLVGVTAFTLQELKLEQGDKANRCDQRKSF